MRSSLTCPEFKYFTLLVALLVFLVIDSAGQGLTAQAPTAWLITANSRPCSENPVLAASSKSKPSGKLSHPVPPDPLPACLEVQGQPIEIQEFLQSAVRDFQWRIGENHASEDSWNFVRYLNDEELEKYGGTKVLVEPVEFTGGKAALLVRTTELKDSYARVQISAHIQGEGKSTDKVWAQPGNLWPLRSKGLMEQELIGALRTRFKHAE
jgi:hypothetical protein